MEQTLKQKQAKFLFDTVNHFNSINRGKVYPWGNKCSYAAGCAIGRHITYKELRLKMDEAIHMPDPKKTMLWCFGETELHENVFNLLPDNLKELGNKFLRHVQQLHDELPYWNTEGITENGRQFLAQIIYYFKLQKEYTLLAYGR